MFSTRAGYDRFSAWTAYAARAHGGVVFFVSPKRRLSRSGMT